MGEKLLYTIGYYFGDTYISFGGLKFAIRLSTNGNIYCPSPEHTRTVEENGTLRLISNRLWAAGGQLSADGSLELAIERKDKDGPISINGRGEHATELCKSLLIHVIGIDIQYFDADSDNMGKREFQHPTGIQPLIYPGREATMPLVIIGEAGAGNGTANEWYALSKDSLVRKKGFAAYYDREEDAPVLILSFEEDRRNWNSQIVLPEWRVGKLQSRAAVVAERFADLEYHFGVKPFRDREDVQWIEDIRVVVNFHGEHWTGHVFNTFLDMEEQLRDICGDLPGKHVLAFLPAWDGRYYCTYPYHSPGERLGGESGLRRLVETAHLLGVKIIPMLGGPNLATRRFLQEHDLLDAALKDSEGFAQIQDWIDWNSDLSQENMGFILNYGHPDLRAYMLDKADELIHAYGFDGIFLDGAIRWSNAPDYSPYEGVAAFADEFAKRNPGKLLMGEDGYDALWGMFGLFATSWGPLGLENAMLRYTRQTEYLAYPALNGSSGIHEIGWNWTSIDKSKKAFTIPALTLFAGDTKRYRGEIRQKLLDCSDWRLKSHP
ncbi:hypothetical protein [Paenibacillus sacheonensis]|uniref:Alpha-galactosidase n=1 Tax=Paenibacillus sacheonensis TaxID=742054 RepID=A0A7X4YR85_9BACL|nr:hypothetical protein [Paenibacillus sacheonensis]MBM7565141.1 hypothetical protein [Paenibacillus sacheonensis]NBC70079.1 hypothetical protein [Paenibacillus sacheonensis]